MLTAVRGWLVYAVSVGMAPRSVLSHVFEIADDRDLPVEARGESARMAWRLRARHRLPEVQAPVEQAGQR